jgi:replication factor A2
VTRLVFIGQVRNIVSQTTNIAYKLDDGTGMFEVRQWAHKDSDNSSNNFGDAFGGGDDGGSSTVIKPEEGVTEGVFLRVMGSLRSFNNKRSFSARVIQKVDDYNEVMLHLLEAAALHLYYTRGAPPTAGGANGQAGQGGAQAIAAPGGRNLPYMTPKASTIYALIEQAGVAEGLHAQNLASQSGMSVQDVITAATELQNAGVIYPTIDDETWAVYDQ